MKKLIIIITILLIIIGILGITYVYFKKPDFSIPKYVAKEYNLKKEEFYGSDIYCISPKENKKDVYILYQHGGSYTTNLTSTYWKFLTDIVKDTGCTIVIPDYPLTPEFYYQDVFDMMCPLYEEMIKKVGKSHLIVMGDSAGGGLSLALCQVEGEKGIEQPDKLILISPWLDVTMNNEEIDQVQPKDPLLKKDLLKLAGNVYARDTNQEDYRISPINGPLTKLENITIFTGTYDILNPDARKFTNRAKQIDLEIDYREYEKAVHIWLLSHTDKSVYQAEEAYQDLIKLINKGE